MQSSRVHLKITSKNLEEIEIFALKDISSYSNIVFIITEKNLEENIVKILENLPAGVYNYKNYKVKRI